MIPSKVRENRPHAVYKSRKLFDMERFHAFLDGKLVVLTRENIVNYHRIGLIIKSHYKYNNIYLISNMLD